MVICLVPSSQVKECSTAGGLAWYSDCGFARISGLSDLILASRSNFTLGSIGWNSNCPPCHPGPSGPPGNSGTSCSASLPEIVWRSPSRRTVSSTSDPGLCRRTSTANCSLLISSWSSSLSSRSYCLRPICSAGLLGWTKSTTKAVPSGSLSCRRRAGAGDDVLTPSHAPFIMRWGTTQYGALSVSIQALYSFEPGLYESGCRSSVGLLL